MRIMWRKILFWGILSCILFFPTYSKIQKLKQRERDLSRKLERLTGENKRLSNENKMLKTDPVYIEDVARQEMKVAGSNEIIYRVVNSDTEK